MTLPEIAQRTADVSDRATDLEMESTQHAIDDVTRKCQRDQEPGPDGVYKVLDCVECGNEIGLGRLEAALRNKLCIECASAAEKRR